MSSTKSQGDFDEALNTIQSEFLDGGKGGESNTEIANALLDQVLKRERARRGVDRNPERWAEVDADTIKKIGSAVGKTALDLGTQWVSGKIQQGQAMAQQKLEQAQAQAEAYANNVQSQVQGYVQQGVAQGQQYMQQGLQQGQQYGQQMYQQGMAQGQQYVDMGGRMVRQGVQQAQQAIYDEFGRVVGYR